jgi:hypothetical protein
MAEKSTASLYEAITEGISPAMPAYGDQLDENERWLLASYLRTLTFASAELSATSETPAPEAYPSPGSEETPFIEVSPTLTVTQAITGSVAVSVVNGSGGESPSDAVVTLYGFDEMILVYTQTLESGEGGLYMFKDVKMPLGRVFLAGVEYDGGAYGSDIAVAEQGPADLTLEVTVYETSADTSLLTIDRVHIFFDFVDTENVQVIEVFIVSNPSTLSVVAAEEGGPVAFFPLPEGATNLQFQDGTLGERYLEMPGGFADTLTVEPGMGQYQVVVAFEMPYDRGLDFTQSMAMHTDAVVVMFPDLGVKIKSDSLQSGGVRDFQGTSYQLYNGGQLEAGSRLTFSLSGRPKLGSATLTGISNTQNLAIGLGAFGLALVAAGFWLYRRNKAQAVEVEAEEEIGEAILTADELPDDPGTLIDAIITLDDLYQAGELPGEAYQARRAALKEKLGQMLENKA